MNPIRNGGWTVARREVLLGLAAVAMAGGLPTATAARGSERFLGGRIGGEREAFATGFDTGGGVVFDIPLPARMHGAARRPGHAEAVLMARRPGTFGMAVDTAAGRVIGRFACPAGHWFNGHAVFAGDGRLLATETVMASGEGVVGVYDATAGYRRIGDFAAGGMEPHDIGLLGDGRTVAIANGGLLRDPEDAKVKRNIDTMRPNLAYADAGTGRLLQTVAPPPALHKAGTRHLSVAADDTVAVVMQYEGAAGDVVPLIALHRRGEAGLTMLNPPADALRALEQYCGDVAFDRAGEVIAVTSPRGGTVLFWDRAGGYIGRTPLADGCGVAGDGDGGFVVTSGLGGIIRWLPDLAAAAPLPGRASRLHWDNHLLAL